MKTVLAFLAVPPVAAVLLGVVWVLDRAAGTYWALPIAIGAVVVAFWRQWLSDHRPSRSTPRQRADERQQRRDRMAA